MVVISAVAVRMASTAQRYTQTQPLVQLPYIEVELVLIAHASSLWVPR